jgi:LCP family protein required for cell wall assembly
VIRHARTRRRHPILRSLALVALAAVSFGATGAATGYVRLENNIETFDVTRLTGPPPTPEVQEPVDPTDPNAGRALNYLVMGSDVRDGENALIGGEVEGMRSDTTIIVHISAARDRVEMVSIPRDSHVQIPDCLFYDGTSSRPQEARFNAAFATGAKNDDVGEAAACTIRTVQALTGITIDGWVVVDFAGFRNMVDALGGVSMCLPEDMSSDLANLYITGSPEFQTLDGSTALAFARARTGKGLGNGSDIMRIARQQQLLGTIAKDVLSRNILTDSAALYRFLNATTQSLKADPDTGNITNLVGLGFSLQNVPSGNIVFMTVPHVSYPADRNQVVWTSDASKIWAALISDTPLVPPAVVAVPTPGVTPTPGATVAPVAPVAEPPTYGNPFSPDDLPQVCG